jgi:membrane protein DedA with SNARE-associated domain
MEELLLRYGYVLLFFGVIVEGDAALITAAYLAHRGYLRVSAVFLVAAVATTLANQAFYWISRRYAHLLFKEGTAAHEKSERAKRWVARRGDTLLFFSRFIFGFRTAIPAACGAADMPAFKFFWLNAAGAVVWVLAFGFGGHALGHVAEIAYSDLKRHEWFIAAVLLLAVFAVVVWRSHGRELREIGILMIHPGQLPNESVELVSGKDDPANRV